MEGRRATGNSSPKAAWSWAGLASARACATSAASASWCWRMAKRSVADGVLPPGWRRSRRTARQRAHWLRSAHARFTGGIRYHWWAVPHLPGGVNNGAFAANGVFGQFNLRQSDRAGGLALQSAWRQPHDSDAAVENDRDDQSRGARAPNGPSVIGLQRADFPRYPCRCSKPRSAAAELDEAIGQCPVVARNGRAT